MLAPMPIRPPSGPSAAATRRAPSTTPALDARDRHLGEHLPSYVVENSFLLAGASFLLGVCVLFQILVQNWEIAAGFSALIVLNLLAVRYARRPECPHLPARILCAIGYVTLRSPATRRVIRLHVRLPLLFAYGILLYFALRLRFPIGHDRPPLIDPRRLYSNTHWDWLREHRFFVDPPPPPAPPPAP